MAVVRWKQGVEGYGKELSPKSREIYSWMFNSTMEYGYQPSIREVGEKFGISSPNGTYSHYRALERYGYIGFRGKNHAGVVFLKTPAGEPFRGFTHKPE